MKGQKSKKTLEGMSGHSDWGGEKPMAQDLTLLSVHVRDF